MDGTENRRRLVTLVLAAASLLVVPACSGGGVGDDKAGGSGEPVVLRLANTNGDLSYTPAVEYFVNHLKELSAGNVRIDVVDRWGDFASDAESRPCAGSPPAR